MRSWIVCPALVQCFLEFVSAVSPLAKLSPAANHLWLNLDTAVGILGGWHLLGNRPGALGASMTKKKKAKEQHAQAQAASVALQFPGAHPVPAMAWSGASLHCCSLLPCSLLMAFLGRQVPLQSQQADFESSARHRYLHSEGPEELEEVSMSKASEPVFASSSRSFLMRAQLNCAMRRSKYFINSGTISTLYLVFVQMLLP